MGTKPSQRWREIKESRGRVTAKPESGPHPKAITYGLTVKVPLHHADLVALFVFNFWDAVGAIGELEDLLWSG
jgi:hypothetical protein